MSITALSMDEAKKKLRELEKYLPPSTNVIIFKFGRFLADQLNPSLVPIGFIMACELALNDLRTGIDGYTEQPIRNSLVGYPPAVYVLIRMRIPEIADAIFPPNFATEVKETLAAIQQKSQ